MATAVLETGKTYEDANLTDFGYTAVALGWWAGHAEKYLADERMGVWGTRSTAASGRSSATRRSASSG